jgi:hypothetical protein
LSHKTVKACHAHNSSQRLRIRYPVLLRLHSFEYTAEPFPSLVVCCTDDDRPHDCLALEGSEFVSHRFRRLPCFGAKLAWVVGPCCRIWSGTPPHTDGVRRQRTRLKRQDEHIMAWVMEAGYEGRGTHLFSCHSANTPITLMVGRRTPFHFWCRRAWASCRRPAAVDTS